MKTTLAIDDELLRDLEELAQRDGVSLTETVNHVLHRGLLAWREDSRSPYHEKSYPMGEPKVDLTKAMALAAGLEDEEVLEELARQRQS